MAYQVVHLDLSQVSREKSIHALFQEVFGFPEFYGHNWDAWIDCMSYLDAPHEGMTKVTVGPEEILVMNLSGVSEFRKNYAEQFDSLLSCTAFANLRNLQGGSLPHLVLAYGD